MTLKVTESDVEDAALSWLVGLGYTVAHGPEIAPEGLFSERTDYGQVVLMERLRQAIERLNPTVPPEAREDALRKVLRVHQPALVTTLKRPSGLTRTGRLRQQR
jgi:type I restriction enzyme R subunit